MRTRRGGAQADVGALSHLEAGSGRVAARPVARLERLSGDAVLSAAAGPDSAGISVLLIERGTAVVDVAGEETQLAAGTLYVSDESPAVEGSELRGWRLTVPARAGHRPRPVAGVYSIGGSFRSRCETFFQALADELSLGAAGDASAVHALLDLILLSCTRAIGSLPSRAAAGVSPTAERLAREVQHLIDHRFAERLSLADVAHHLSRSPASVARAVRDVTGHSVLELIAERRLEEACTLLRDSDLPVSEVAARVGYPTLGYFHRMFRRIHGTTPQRWRAAREDYAA